MERESSDEEEDRENLIDQNGYKASHSTFQIGELDHRIRRHFAFNKKYLIAICLPLLAIVVFLSVDSSRLFHSVPTVRIDSRADRMRESELHALYLLRNQQLGLLNLWNRTFSHSNRDSSLIPMPNSTSNSTLKRDDVSSLPFEDFRSALLQQIKLNKEIQQHLLSSHRVGNASTLMDDNADGESLGFGVDACSKLDRMKRNRTIEWKPKPNRYLFAICVSGQMSNHLICLEKHMFFAALLDRVLVLPSPKFDYEYDRVIDIEHINECFGRKVVISFDEFAQVKKNKLHIDRLICYVAKPTCYLDEDHIKKLKSAGVSLGKIEAALPEDVKVDEPKKRTFEDTLQNFHLPMKFLQLENCSLPTWRKNG